MDRHFIAGFMDGYLSKSAQWQPPPPRPNPDKPLYTVNEKGDRISDPDAQDAYEAKLADGGWTRDELGQWTQKTMPNTGSAAKVEEIPALEDPKLGAPKAPQPQVPQLKPVDPYTFQNAQWEEARKKGRAM